MKTLDKKLFRDLWNIKSQAITIGLVVATGVANLISFGSNYDSLQIARDSFYSSKNLAQGFVYCKVAPESILKEIQKIPGIYQIESRIIKEVTLDFSEEIMPTGAKLISYPKQMNLIHLKSGNPPKGENEVVINEAFAILNHLKPGDRVVAILEGRRKVLEISGIGLSPEFVYLFRPGLPLPDNKHYGVMWMESEAMESVFQMQSSFNEILFHFTPGQIQTRSILKSIDDMLEPYGGLGADTLDHLPSNKFLKDEFTQLESTSRVIPMIFFGVAAFLLHTVTSRMVTKEKEQIATLKALGYHHNAIILYYLKLILIITLFGSIVGVMLGGYLGKLLLGVYEDFYKFPKLDFIFNAILAIQGVFVGLLIGATGSYFSVRKVILLQPAEAMRPPVPENFQNKNWEFLVQSFKTNTRMTIRNLIRRPMRTILAILGLSSSVMIMIVGTFFYDTIDVMMNTQFNLIQKENLSITLLRPIPRIHISEFMNYNGVLNAEGLRIVPIRLLIENQTKETAIQGVDPQMTLRRFLDKDKNNISFPADGIAMNIELAQSLGIQRGDLIRFEVLEGNRKQAEVRVGALINEVLGRSIYIDHAELSQLLGEGEMVNQVLLSIDQNQENNLIKEFKDVPNIAGLTTKFAILRSFRDTIDRSIMVSIFILVFFAIIISVGVIYNTAMITLSERIFELATLRILGFSIWEVFLIVIGELTFLILISIPLGCVLGYWFSWFFLQTVETNEFQIPLIIHAKTYILSAIASIFTSLFSFYILYNKLKNMDLISVLKTRE